MNRLAFCLLVSAACGATQGARAQTIQPAEFSYQYEHPGRQPSASVDPRDQYGYAPLRDRSWDSSLSWDRPRYAPLEPNPRFERSFNQYER